MLIAVFKPKADANGEGQEVWGKLHQKEVTRDQLADHLDDGWVESAAEALVEAELGDLGKENRALKRMVEPDGAPTIDQIKAMHAEEMEAMRAQFDASWKAREEQYAAAAETTADAPKVDGRSKEARAAKAPTAPPAE
jgi:hypothetical protein